MKARSKKHGPEIIVKDGKPRAVILDIDEYQEMLERLEDVDDLEMLQKMRQQPLLFRKLEDFLKKWQPVV